MGDNYYLTKLRVLTNSPSINDSELSDLMRNITNACEDLDATGYYHHCEYVLSHEDEKYADYLVSKLQGAGVTARKEVGEVFTRIYVSW